MKTGVHFVTWNLLFTVGCILTFNLMNSGWFAEGLVNNMERSLSDRDINTSFVKPCTKLDNTLTLAFSYVSRWMPVYIPKHLLNLNLKLPII